MDQTAQWCLTDFVEKFQSQLSPELLVNIMVDALAELERHHRRGLLHGALGPDCIQISEKGQVAIINWTRSGPVERRFEAPEIARGQRSTPATDIYSIAAIFNAFMPGGPRVHPDLKALLYRGLTERFRGAWMLRSMMLDYLADMGMEGGVFFVSRFLADPTGYNRSLIAVLSDRECRHIRYLNKHGRRRKATAELNFLLEIAPVNRQALNLWRAVKQGRRRVLGHLSYAALLVAVVVVCASVIAEKLGLPIAGFSLP